MDSQNVRGWTIHHQEQFIFQTNAGTPTIHLKFYHYPSYRQTVRIEKSPQDCKLKIKGNNAFFVFQKKVGTKGIISLERIITVIPIPSVISLHEDWGKISDFPQSLQRKYKQSSLYWPVKSNDILDISKEDWFGADDLSIWVESTSRYITEKLKHRENQEKRLGASQAFLTGIGDCDEFTDLFVTIARIRGVPSRRLTGYFITHNGSSAEGHAWGEILSSQKGWVPVDVALHNIGAHRVNYVIVKIEEFNPDLPDYQVQIKRSRTVHYRWMRPHPLITPLF